MNEIKIVGFQISQEKYVAVRPNGSICGPTGEDYEFVKHSLITGYLRTNPTFVGGEEEVWKKIVNLGYQIKRASITILED